jgi:hypothetical protein
VIEAFPPAEKLVNVTLPVDDVDLSSVSAPFTWVAAAVKSPSPTEIVLVPDAVRDVILTVPSKFAPS